ncbi:MAG: protein kinase domain-containing protein [Acidimicrobiales bacterium]
MTETPSPTASSVIATGHVVAGRYRLVRELARGGMAQVWEAVDDVLTRPVAIKILAPTLASDETFVTRFRQEAVAAARLSHPHIVSIYDTCGGGEVEAIVMELVRGTTLRQLLDERAPLPVGRAVEIATQVADALGHAHDHGLVHRDIKPGNILLADDRVLVADFGIAKAAAGAADLTDAGQVIGTARYLSPEQVHGGAVDARSDVYALGVVLYEMLCGCPPFGGDSATAVAVARLTTDPAPPRQLRADLPIELDQVVRRALARQPEQRYATAAELEGALAAVGAVAAVRPRRAGHADSTSRIAARHHPEPSPPAPRFAQTERSWLVPAALIVAIAAVVGLMGLLLGRTEAGRDLLGAVGGAGGVPAAGGEGGVLEVASVASFDPGGSRGEHDEELPFLVDGDPGTAWTTERYNSRDVGGLKPGVGFVLTLAQPADIKGLELTSPTRDWSAAVYVADETAPTLAGWGEPVTAASSLAGTANFDLGGRRGTNVLVWITDLGNGSVGPTFSATIAEATLRD